MKKCTCQAEIIIDMTDEDCQDIINGQTHEWSFDGMIINSNKLNNE